MIIAWMIFASTGIIIARYFKFLLPNTKLCNLQIWFVIHRPMMMCVPIISIAAFILILWEADWQWISLYESTTFFTHSIFGIVTIGLSIVQVKTLSTISS